MSVTAWETAYRQYGQASERSLTPRDREPGAVWQMASASWAVAAAWRQIAAAGQLPWWSLAAVESAAQAFEAQAREWEARENRSEPEPTSGGAG
jgi:hypothetical protein